MKIIGLTGGIASGKSTIASMLQKANIPVIDADDLSHQVTRINTPALEEIKTQLGNKFINTDGSLNRKLLGDYVFTNNSKLKILEKIIHPRIYHEFKKLCKNYYDKNYSYIIYMAPLLFETNFYKKLHKNILVISEEQTVISRLIKRDNLNIIQAQKRLEAQLSNTDKIKLADEVLLNMGTLHNLKIQIGHAWRRITGQLLIL